MIRGRAAVLVLAAALIAAPPLQAAAAKKKKPAAKPAAKKPAPRVVKGTTQLKGDQAQFGLEYTLGKGSPMNITLKSAEYTVVPLHIGENLYIPKENTKLLVLHYTLHNPQHQEAQVRFDTFGFTVVDPEGTNQEFISAVGSEASQKDLDMNLKPAQKVEAYTAVQVPAKAEMPKLIIKASDELVLRYDLKGKVKPLPAPFADPEDKSGFTALGKVPATLGTYYSLGDFDVKVDGLSFRDTKIMENELEEGQRFVVIALTARNRHPAKRQLRFDTLNWSVRDQDGAEVEGYNNLLAGSRDADLDTELEPGQEIKARRYYRVPKDLGLKTLSVKLGDEGRAFVYDVSGLK
ncbi:MAG TPA: DUF4352 domain-containing protein [Armatimonadota bacterium]|jgi:hypothetical protein